VGGTVTGDILEGITPASISFKHPEVVPEPPQTELSVDLAGPWSFYGEFRRDHALTNLPHPEPPEIALQLGAALVIPVRVHNATAAAQEIVFAVDLPPGWTLQSGVGKFSAPANETSPHRIEINLPPMTDSAPRKQDTVEITVRAESQGKAIGIIKLRVQPRKRALPE
jgi:hypothetical protein